MARRSCTKLEAAMSEQDNLRIIHEAFAAWNAHDVDRYGALLDEGYVEGTHTMQGPVRGREAARGAMREQLRGLPDLHFQPAVLASHGYHAFTRGPVHGAFRPQA